MRKLIFFLTMTVVGLSIASSRSLNVAWFFGAWGDNRAALCGDNRAALWDDTLDIPATDSAASLPSARRDSALSADSTILPFIPDTIISLGAGSLASSLQERGDSTDSVRRKPGIDSPVDYTSKDSLVYDAETGFANLYGAADVRYQSMQITAEHMTINMDSSLVHATGVKDSVDALVGMPVFKNGNTEYASEKMAFNFKTKKGFIQNVNTQEGNGYLQSDHTKRTDDGTMYMKGGRYTTCDDEHPHFYLKLTRAKVHPGKDIIFGPAYLVVEDVPLPLAIPYGFFPFSKKFSSGILMPTFGEESTRGFYLRDGGYYFALSDHFDLKLLGEIYTKGSWGLSGEVNYTQRYKYRGNFYVSYLTTIDGEKNMPDYSKSTSLKLQWSHTKDTKADPNTSFSARVNFATQDYERKNLESYYNPMSATQSTRASSVSFSHNFTKIGLTISASGNFTQNMRDSTIAVTLPDLSIQLNRFYPFRRKHAAGTERWYEKISISYTGQISNSITAKENRLLKSDLLKDWRNGIQHRVPIDATFQIFKYINVSPSFTLRDLMYTSRVMRSWDTKAQREVCDTVRGFYNLYDWNAALGVNTTLYGFYKPWKKFFGDRIEAIRHVFKPSVSVSFAPDFTTAHYGYTTSYVRTDASGEVTTVMYSPYQGALYGYPSSKKQGMLNFSVSNNLEMKIKSEKDSTGVRKISLIDEFGASMSYNFAAQTKPWSDLNTRLRIKLSKSYTLSLAAVFATYAYAIDKDGHVYVSDKTEYSQGRFGRFQGMSQNISYTLNNEKLVRFWNLITGRGNDNERLSPATRDQDDEYINPDDEANIDPDMRQKREPKKKSAAEVDEDGYLKFAIPWNLTISYGVTMREDTRAQINLRRMRYPYSFTHTLNFSGNVQISRGWNINFTSGYDFNYHDFSTSTVSLSRDLHCFEMSASVVLKPYTSYNFTFRARASELADALKWEKRSSYSQNVQWY